MRITEAQLRRIVREEIESVQRKKDLIVQDDGVSELSGYDVDRPATPGGEGSHRREVDHGSVYEADDDFMKIRLARLKASGVPPERAEKMARSKLKHRGKRPGKG